MTGLRRLDRDISSFQIANLTHHDYVWILTQECAQGGGESQPGFFIHIDLIHAR